MLNPDDKAKRQATPKAVPRRPVDTPDADPALELGEIKLVKPLQIADEDPGGDPYNRTGRFSVEK